MPLTTGKGTSAKFSSNANTGGTCFGDSGGPIFVSGTTTLVAVVSFGTSSTCSGTSGAYRLDQADDLAFLATFGITPEGGVATARSGFGPDARPSRPHSGPLRMFR
jgi:hypothetical protein